VSSWGPRPAAQSCGAIVADENDGTTPRAG
jgi:hypothetical protein